MDSYINLIHLRSRYYAPETGRFTTRDTWRGDYNRPLSLNRWNYVEGNPINRVDPTGKYWWRMGQGLFDASEKRFQSQNIHVRIQALSMMDRGMKQIHAEYMIPGTTLHVDLMDSVTGEVWEIKPWDYMGEAAIDVANRLFALTAAQEAELLEGIDPVGMPYNWNFAPPTWNAGTSFPPEVYIGTDDTGWFDFYAGQAGPGIILWWKQARRTKRPSVPYPIFIPDKVKWSQRNFRPGWQPALEPVTAYDPWPSPTLGEITGVGIVCGILYMLLEAGEVSICGPCVFVLP